MIKHRKDTQQLTEAYDMIRNESQTIDEKGGMLDRALAKSPIAKMFGGVSQRAAGRVTSKNDSKKMMDRFWATLGRNNKPVTVGQLKEFFARTVPQLGSLKNSLPVLQGMGDDEMLKPRQVKKMMPKMVDQIHEIIASGSSSDGAEEVDPNSMFGAAPVATPQAPASQAAPPQNTGGIEAQLQDTQQKLTDDKPETPDEHAKLQARVDELEALLAKQSGGGENQSNQAPSEPATTQAPTPIKPAISARGEDGRAYSPTGTLMPVDPATGEPQHSLPNPVDSKPKPSEGPDLAGAVSKVLDRPTQSRDISADIEQGTGQGSSEQPSPEQSSFRKTNIGDALSKMMDKQPQSKGTPVIDFDDIPYDSEIPGSSEEEAPSTPDRGEIGKLGDDIFSNINLPDDNTDAQASQPQSSPEEKQPSDIETSVGKSMNDEIDAEIGATEDPDELAILNKIKNKAPAAEAPAAPTEPAATTPAKRKKTGGKVKGQLSQTHNAIRKREARARKKAESAPAKKKSKLSKTNKEAIADSPFANVKYERYNVLGRPGFMSKFWGKF